MFVVFFGNDTVGVRSEAHELIGSYEANNYTIEYIDSDTYTSGVLSDAAGATSLFGGERLYVIDTPSEQIDFYTDVVEHLAALKESANTFVVIEGALLAPEKKKFAKYAEHLEEAHVTAGEKFNTFALADALAKKDKRSLWLCIIEARRAGMSPEKIISILWWQLKSLRLASVTASAQTAGMKDFPYNKAKRALGNFMDGEVDTLARTLLRVYHEGHLGNEDIDLALEQWCLSL